MASRVLSSASLAAARSACLTGRMSTWSMAARRSFVSMTRPAAAPAVVVVGSNIIDLIAYTERLPEPGETVHGHGFQMGFGGKGANQAVQAARLGSEVAMVTTVGDDTFGRDTLQNFKDEGVDSSFVFTSSEEPTGTAPISVDSSGRNCIVVCTAANMTLTPEQVEGARSVIAGASTLVCQNEIPIESTLKALTIGREEGVTTIFNPAPAPPTLDDALLQVTDYFCPNETEAALLTGMPTDTLEGCEAAARELMRRGAKNVIMTIGSRGSMWINEKESVVVPATKVAAVDTTGAGDSYIGSFAHFLSKGHPVPEAMRRASEVAGVSVTGKGTQSSYARAANLPSWLFEQ